MSYKGKCKECGKAFTALRKGKEFCKPACQINFHQKKKRALAKIDGFRQQILKLEERIQLDESSLSINRSLGVSVL